MNSANPRLVIRRSRPWLFRVAAIGVVAVLVVGALGLYRLGRMQAGQGLATALSENVQLSARLSALQRDLAQLRERDAKLQSFRSIDEQATRQVRDSLRQLQHENSELRQELQFYRNIVAPAKGRTGLNIQNFKVDQGSADGQYHYKLTLIHVPQMKGRQKLASGVVELSVDGSQKGIAKTLGMADIIWPRGTRIEYNIKYFRQFEGDIMLPKNFVPRAITVRVIPKNGEKGDILEQKIQWPLAAD